MSKSFRKLTSVSCGTKRSPVTIDGVRGDPETELSGLRCLPLDPLTPELRTRLELDTPYELLQTMIEGGPDIKEDDILTVGSNEYTIRSVADWMWEPTGADTLLLVLEELKR